MVVYNALQPNKSKITLSSRYRATQHLHRYICQRFGHRQDSLDPSRGILHPSTTTTTTTLCRKGKRSVISNGSTSSFMVGHCLPHTQGNSTTSLQVHPVCHGERHPSCVLPQVLCAAVTHCPGSVPLYSHCSQHVGIVLLYSPDTHLMGGCRGFATFWFAARECWHLRSFTC